MKINLLVPLAIVTLFLSSLTSCNYNPENKAGSNKFDINESITAHKDEMIFLNFWPTMTVREFDKVRHIESSNGTLRNGQFILDLSLDDLAFDLSLKDNAIILHHRDEYWGTGSSSSYTPHDTRKLDSQGSKYRNSRSYLKNYFISKYNRYEEVENSYPKRTAIFDDVNERTILLELQIYVFEAHKSYEPVRFVGNLKWDKKREKARYAYRDFTISYMSTDEYQKRVDERQKRIEEQNNRMEQNKEDREANNDLL